MILDSLKRKSFQVDFRVFMDVGPRDNQEDAVMAGERIFQRESMDIAVQDQGEPLAFVVCDGMGGHAAGEVCSRFVLDEFKGSLSSSTASRDGVDMMLNMIQTATEEALPVNSGTTIAGLLISGGKGLVFNAGDSRVYRLRGGSIERCSHDHSYVQNLVDKGAITSEDAFTHPYRNVVSFGIGSAFSELWRDTKVHYQKLDLTSGDSFLVCSDGVSDIIEDTHLSEILGPEPLRGAHRLRTELKRKGLKDNTSYILLTIQTMGATS